MPDPATKQQRRGALLIITALTVAAGLYQALRWGKQSSAQRPMRFTMQAEPRLLPEFVFVDGDGRTMNLAQLRGKVVLLNIWATWCPPCRTEMPSLDRLQQQLGSENFEVVALSIDTRDQAVLAIRSFYESIGIRKLRVYLDPRGTAGFDLGTVGVPTTLLLDRKGRELGRMTGAAEWDSAEAIAFLKQHIERRTR